MVIDVGFVKVIPSHGVEVAVAVAVAVDVAVDVAVAVAVAVAVDVAVGVKVAVAVAVDVAVAVGVKVAVAVAVDVAVAVAVGVGVALGNRRRDVACAAPVPVDSIHPTSCTNPVRGFVNVAAAKPEALVVAVPCRTPSK